MGKQLKQSSRKATIVPFIQNGEYFFKKGMKAYDRGDLHKARKYFERAVRLDERDASFALQLALVLSELGEYQFSNQWLFKIIHDLDETMDDCLYFWRTISPASACSARLGNTLNSTWRMSRTGSLPTMPPTCLSCFGSMAQNGRKKRSN
ncbi:tetratricopeptide repeat protein [Geobacillus stearothermophilus]|nr:tetratricopeptide repeat protein [Geobacillus stearothermophilus]MED3747838.1 tetratricopeptide repeat protein [Geobacillus stearothermophilus]MED3753892.1 tetratricopeptide repeat protein [Geobacillus stearothermophilus]MED3768908.1 tetratricopeptide repeat protein [Geobacillus stearothermophilus]MED3771110.1 tetratricopeptide repeat protein [Geobacillus stearothermophilus]